jgi:DNA-binding winged helix-turn-helix (wHTH) protein
LGAWLRQKLEDNPQTPRHIHTARGVGYRFSAVNTKKKRRDGRGIPALKKTFAYVSDGL